MCDYNQNIFATTLCYHEGQDCFCVFLKLKNKKFIQFKFYKNMQFFIKIRKLYQETSFKTCSGPYFLCSQRLAKWRKTNFQNITYIILFSTSKVLLIKAKSGASGNADTNNVTNPYCKTISRYSSNRSKLVQALQIIKINMAQSIHNTLRVAWQLILRLKNLDIYVILDQTKI